MEVFLLIFMLHTYGAWDGHLTQILWLQQSSSKTGYPYLPPSSTVNDDKISPNNG
jgi:hypothetical protein